MDRPVKDYDAIMQAMLERIEAQLTHAESVLNAAIAAENEKLATISARLDRLEAAVIIQTGTVFGAQGDSEPMTIEHMIEPGKEA